MSGHGNRLGRTVLNHCQIVGEVAREVISRLPDGSVRHLFPAGGPLVAAAHDIGKVSPCFVEKLLRACPDDPAASMLPRLSGVDPSIESQWGGHAGVSQVTTASIAVPRYIPEILGQHHGFSPALAGRSAQAQVFGGSPWHEQRIALIETLKQRLGTDWPVVESPAQARVLAGLTSVADWIGSGQFFEDPALPWEGSIKAAVDAAGFIRPRYRRGLSFSDIFGEGFAPRPMQKSLIDLADGPGVYTLEAPMGGGKTEAALYAAYRAVSEAGASGIYFALPTQLTSNKIYERFNTFLAQILEEDCRHRALLLHGQAWMLEATDMGEEGRPGGSWFQSAKRGLLAPFAVGTIDQALMAAMNVKHGFVRAFGLAGKVVILDEVHTYDAYTGTIMDALIALLRELHCTVIILSATLSQQRRRRMLDRSNLSSQAYPLITGAPNHDNAVEVEAAPPASRRTELRLIYEDESAMQEAMARAEHGEQVLWIENTVHESQERYLELCAHLEGSDVHCGLLHSKFTSADRQAIEDQWTDLFGKPGRGRRGERGRILVGTQVLEQSLDIDADFLVTRIAPTDMLLQRIGRLWRHAETPRPNGAKPLCWILAPRFLPGEPQREAFGASAFVYSPYVLNRSLEVWAGRTSVTLPDEIRALIEATYEERGESGVMADLLGELENGRRGRPGRRALMQLAGITLSQGGKTLPEEKAQTRYNEEESLTALLVRALEPEPAAKRTRITLLDGRTVYLPWRRIDLDRQEWRKLSIELTKQTVALRPRECPAPNNREYLEKLGLGYCFYLGFPDQGESLLRVGVVDAFGRLEGAEGGRDGTSETLIYRNDIGFRREK